MLTVTLTHSTDDRLVFGGHLDDGSTVKVVVPAVVALDVRSALALDGSIRVDVPLADLR